MGCVIPEEFPLLPYEPTPRGETLAHWRNEIDKVWKTAREEWCLAEREVDLSGIESDIAALKESVSDIIQIQLPHFPYTALGIFYAPTPTSMGQIGIGTANQILGVNSGVTGYEYKTIQGTASEINVDLSMPGVITLGLVDPLAVSKGGTGQSTILAAFNALSPATVRGDLITRDATNNVRLPIGTAGKYTRSDGTDPSWSLLLASDLSGTVAIASGGTGQATAVLGFNALSPLTTRGDLLTRDATNNIRLGVGTIGQYLTTDGVDISWGTAPGGETNTASNVGTVGTGVFKQKTGVNLEFYKLNSADTKMAIALVGTDRIDFTIDANNVVAASTDARLSDARTPTAHASTHFSLGSDAIRIDELKIATDVTTLNSTITEHGLLKKLSGTATEFMNGAGNWATPSGVTPAIHNVLDSTYHGDVLTGSIARGDLLVGNLTPKISKLAIGTVGKYLYTDGTDPSWKQIAFTELSGTLGITQGGTGQITALLAFNALSPISTRGDLITRDATNNIRLGIGGLATYLRSDATDPGWSALLAADLSGTVAILNGGTGQTTAILGFNALSPLSTRGDLLTRDATNNIRLAIGTVGKYLRTDGTDPSWQTISTADITTTLTGIIQGTGSGALTGITGTANYFPKWSATAQYLTASTNLLSEDANTVALINSTAAQSLRIYGTYTDTLNYERLTIKHFGSSSGIVLNSEALGTGTARDFKLIGGKTLLGDTSGQTPLFKLHVMSDNSVLNSFGIDDTQGYAAGVGGQMWFRGKYSSGGSIANFARISGEKENATDGNSAGVLKFYTPSTGAATTEKLRISSDGNIGIGVTTFGASMAGGMAMKNGTAPSGNVADSFQHYAADIVAGNSAPHWRTETGDIVKLYRVATYTPTNVTTDRTFDANSTSTDELADVLGTLIADLKLTGILA